jgi:hypothetical protein
VPWEQPVRYEYSTTSSGGWAATSWATGATFSVPSLWFTSSSATSVTTLRWSYEGWHQLTYAGAPLTVDHIEPIYEMPGDPRGDIRARTEFDQRQAQAEHEREERHQARIKAQSRAAELLLSLLPTDQRERYRLHGEFEIIGSAGNLYRIRRGSSGNIDWIEPDGAVGGRLCAHPTMRDGWLPDADVALAQFLALTTNEPEFIRLANVHQGRRPPLVPV